MNVNSHQQSVQFHRLERCFVAQPKHPQPNYGAAGSLGCPARPVLRPAHLLTQSGRHDDRQVPLQGGSTAHVHQAADAHRYPRQCAPDARVLQESGLYDPCHREVASWVLPPELHPHLSRFWQLLWILQWGSGICGKPHASQPFTAPVHNGRPVNTPLTNT